MKFPFVLAPAAAVILATAAFAQTSTVVTFKYTQLDYPGAASTVANGINNGNVIVGTYVDSAGLLHGFRYASGAFTAINYPGSGQTTALGINDQGDIVGWYTIGTSTTGTPPHGYLLHGGTFKSIDYPGNTFGTTAVGINKNGVIVGNFDNSQGYVYQNGTFTLLNAPQQAGELIDTVLNGISNLGMVVGAVFTGDDWRGFWTPSNGSDFDYLLPLFSRDNQAYGVNGRGDVVGCQNSGNPFIIFNSEAGEGTESNERFPAFEVPSNPLDQYSCPRSINYARVMVGDVGLSAHGFLAIPVLTLNVTSPANKATVNNPVHVAASASGSNPISQMQVWVNYKQVFHVSGGSLSASINLPVGSNERVVIQAVDSKGVVARTAYTLTVH
jgi:uncharacterized membrane protein